MQALIFFLMEHPGFTDFIEKFGYVGIFLWFISFDQITPIPEEISLLIIGYFSAHGVFNPVIAGVCSMAGFLAVDTAYFFLSKKGSSFIKKRTGNRSSVVSSFTKKLKEHTAKTIFILCFIPRMRMWAPILAGSVKLSFKRFLLFDSIALAVFTGLYLSLGMIFHRSLAAMITKTKGLQNIIFFSAIFVIGALIIFFVMRRKKKAQ